MDTERGRFVEEAEAKPHMERLAVGETVTIKGAEFEVLAIGEREVRLKLLSTEDRRRRTLSELIPTETLDERIRSRFDVPNRHERRKAEKEDRKR